MLDSVVGCVNTSMRLAWEAIAPAVPVVRGHPKPPATLPAECLRIYWLSVGEGDTRAGQVEGMLQVDVFVPNGNLNLALQRVTALGRALGLDRSTPGRLCVYEDGDLDLPIGEAAIRALPDEGWVNVPDPSPGIIHFARTLTITATPLVG